MSKQKRLLFLVLFFILFGSVYWGVGNTFLTLPVTYFYYALCLILSVLYVLVAGGIRPIVEKEREKEKASREKYLKDKGKSHPIKRRDKYRRFKVKDSEENSNVNQKEVPRPNVLKIPEEKREKICQWILVFLIPLYLLFLLDWVYLRFFI
ncbi:MAG: hypothetical protein IKU24_00595 [Clostridia bacterium]|nr:hypothetical protein [Clostridia bacterium]